jgi:hypothetical protein
MGDSFRSYMNVHMTQLPISLQLGSSALCFMSGEIVNFVGNLTTHKATGKADLDALYGCGLWDY